MCGKKAPKPDPLIGQAARDNAALAKEMAGVAREELAWNRTRAEKQDPLLEKIAQQQIDTADVNTARSADQWDSYQTLFKPVEARMVDDANNWDSDERKDRMASEAGADVTRSYQGAAEQNLRQMGRLGVNPNSGKFAALTNETMLGQAKDSAGAMNTARRATEQQGIALRTGVAQFGRNMPNTGIAADSLALNAGQSAGNTMSTGVANRVAGNAAAQQWFGGASSGNNSAGQMGLGLYQGQLQAHQMNQEAAAGMGQLVGTLGVGAAMF